MFTNAPPNAQDQGSRHEEETLARLLLAEDDEDLREFVALILRAHGYEVVEASNGIELLELLQFDSFGEQWSSPFDVVVADFHMPGITGIEALEGLAQAGQANSVVVMSAYTDDDAVARAKQLGAAAFIPKPFQPETLVAAVFKAWASAHGNDAPPQQRQSTSDDLP
jgi:CheY-like chemotaxis protein